MSHLPTQGEIPIETFEKIFEAFKQFYAEKHKEDPESWPRLLREEEWAEAFMGYLGFA